MRCLWKPAEQTSRAATRIVFRLGEREDFRLSEPKRGEAGSPERKRKLCRRRVDVRLPLITSDGNPATEPAKLPRSKEDAG